jgi:hypothetical protein
LPENGKKIEFIGSSGCSLDGARGRENRKKEIYYVYVSVMLMAWCFSSNFYIDATLRLL